MQEVNKNQEELILDHLHETAFQGTGLGRTILGPESNIRSLTRSDLKNYIDTHYVAPKMVIAGAGAIDHGELCNVVGDVFGSRVKGGESRRASSCKHLLAATSTYWQLLAADLRTITATPHYSYP